MIKTITTAVLMIAAMCSFGQETRPFSKGNISMEIPASWLVRDFPQYYILVSEPPQKQISIMTTLDVSIDTIYASLDEFRQGFESKLQSSEVFKEFEIRDKKEIVFQGVPAVEYVCTAEAGGIPVKWKSVLFMKDEKAYKISVTTTPEKFTGQKEIIDAIYTSFKIG